MKPRNLFKTKTMQGTIFLFTAFLMQAVPISGGFIDRKFDKEQAQDIKYYLSLVLAFGGLFRASYGRYQATSDVFTPQFLPGRNREDITSE